MTWGTARALRDRNARLYLGGVLVSGFGDSAMSLAAGIWVKTLTGSNGLAALVGLCLWLPTAAGPVIGVVADRVRRRPLLVAVNLLLAVVMTVPLAVRSSAQAGLLYAALALVGAGVVITDAAEAALVTAALPDELRGDFNGLVRTATESMKLLAPPAGAALFTAFGGASVALLDAATFAVAALAFRLLRVREAAPVRRRAFVADGVRRLWRHPEPRALSLAGGAAMAASGLSGAATYALLDGLHRSPATAAVLLWVQGLGSIAGGPAAGALMRRLGVRVFAAAGLTLFAAGVFARLCPSLPVVLGGSLLIGLGLPWPLIAALTSVQREVPDALLGRVAASAGTLMYGPAGLGLLLGSAMVSAVDYRVQTLLAGGLALVAAQKMSKRQRAACEGDVVGGAC